MKPEFMTAREAVKLIPSQCTLLSEGFVGACFPEELAIALEERFLTCDSPRDLTLIYAAGQGDGQNRGLNHLAHEGMLKKIICSHLNLAPSIQKLVIDNKIQAYNLPMGVMTHILRDTAAGKPGTITKVGLGTFVDPRLEGGRLTPLATDELVEVLIIDGEEYLFYKPFPLDVALLRGTCADERGNISMEKEGLYSSMLASAQACKNRGGLVIVQVEKTAAAGALDPRLVKIPGACVDVVVPAENPANHMQTFASRYNPAFTGQAGAQPEVRRVLPQGIRRTIAARAIQELEPGAVVNLGIGMPESIATLAAELGRDDFVLTVEAGPTGGIPQGGLDFGCAVNPWAIIDMPSQFDFYLGGGLDIAFLGMAQVDRAGNVNVSRFGDRIAGCGGFIDISQSAAKVVFCGAFTAGGLQVEISAEGLNITREGLIMKFVPQVQQVTFNAQYALKKHQEVLYITERATFKLTPHGLALTEWAPGVDVRRDILPQMGFLPLLTTP